MASSTVGTAVIKLSFDGSDVKAELSKTSNQFKSAGEKAGSTFGSALTVAMGSLISKGVSKIISSITSNLDSAINRVDVINNFPKVMESLGFSTDEAAASIKAISDRLDGLPSTLNGVVGDVQKLTATMGNLNTGMVNATSLGLALNDMFLAGGKGTEAASNAMEQYNQMLAQGKPDMQSWRSILNAAPGQLKQVAKTLLGVTANQNDLYEALKNGNISFDQMNEAIVRLDREGGDGFDSFERQARNATGGVGTALENVQNRISKAIAKVIDVIGSENIANAINSISSHFNDIGVEVGKFVKYAMTQIGEFTRFISNNMWIVDTIKGALATILAMELGFKIMALKEKVAQLFTVIAAHPLLALASAIIGIATAISSATSRESELTKAIKDTTEASKKATNEYNSLAESRRQSLSQGMSELSYYEQLQDELKGLVDENGKVKEGYEQRARFIIDKLNDALGLEIQMNDNIVEGYQEVGEAVKKTIELKKAELQLASEEEAYKDAIKKRADSMQRILDLRKQITHAMQTGSFQEVKAAIEAMDALEQEEETYKKYSWDIQRYTDDYAAFVEGRYNDMTDVLWDYSDSLAASETANQIQLQQSIDQTQEKLNYVEKLYNETGSQVYKDQMDAYQKLINGTKEKLNSYKTVNTTTMQQVHDGFCGKLTQTVNDTIRIASGFKTTGQQGGAAIASGFNSKSGTVSGSVSGVLNNAKNSSMGTAWNDGWAIGVQTGSAVVSGVGSQQKPMISVGQMLALGLRDGMNANAWNVVSSVASNIMNDFKSWFGIHSPSTVFRDEIGAMLAKGLGIGFEDEMQSVTADMAGAVPSALAGPSLNYAYANNWSGMVENAIMEQSGASGSANSTINVYMNNTIDNDMSIDELGRKFSQSIRRYA